MAARGVPHFSFFSDEASLPEPDAPAFVQVSASRSDEQDDEELMLLYRPWKDQFLERAWDAIEERTPRMETVIRCKSSSFSAFEMSECPSRF